MDRIIKQITETEAAAQKILKEAKYKEANLDKTIASELEQYRNECMERAKAQIKAETDRENKQQQEKLSQLENDTRRCINAMAEAGKRYRAEWIQSIFGDIIKPVK